MEEIARNLSCLQFPNDSDKVLSRLPLTSKYVNLEYLPICSGVVRLVHSRAIQRISIDNYSLIYRAYKKYYSG